MICIASKSSQHAEGILNIIAKRDLNRLKEYDLGVPNMFCMKSQIEGHKIHQLGSADNSARFDPIYAESNTLPSWNP